MFNQEHLNEWLEKFDSIDSHLILTAILNRDIILEVLAYSLFAYRHGELELAESLYKEMWR